MLRAGREASAAPIVKPLLGKAVVPDDSPYTTGGIGLLGTAPSQDAMQECDTLFIVGSSFPYMEFYPKPGQAKCVQIDIDPTRIGLRYPVDVGLVGDCRTRAAARCCRCSSAKTDRAFLEKAQERMKEWNELMEERGTRTDMPMKPQVVTYTLNKLLRRRRHRLLATAARSPPGRRATSRCAATCSSRSRALLATMAQRPALQHRRGRGLSRTGRSSASSATAASPC